jgi:hypothetical protein
MCRQGFKELTKMIKNNTLFIHKVSKSRCLLFSLAVISILVGLFVFSSIKYKHLTLKIYAITFEKRFQSIFIKESVEKKISTLEFETNGEGYNYDYPLVLSSVSIESLKIAPLGGKGKYEITGIELSNDTNKYIWDSQLNCSEIYILGNINYQKPCNSNAPKIIPKSDLSLEIVGVESVGSENSFVFRFSIAIASVFFIFLSSVLLTKQPSKTCFAVRLVWLLFLGVYLRQLYFISVYSVDLPAWEEWEFFESDALPKGLTLKWLFSFSGEHMVFFHKLMIWINQQLLSLNFSVQRIISYLIFGCLLLAITQLKSKIIGRDSFKLFPVFIIFLISNTNHESHTNTAALSYHFVLLFSVLALYSAFENELKSSVSLFVIWLCFAVISHSTGVIIALMYLIFISIYVVAAIKNKKCKIRAAWILFIMYLPIGVTIAYWGYGYRLPNVFAHPPRTSPLQYRFWDCFFNLTSFGFGFESKQIFIGVFIFLIVVCPVVILLYQRNSRWRPETWTLTAAVITVIAILLTICMGRAWQQGAAKTSRFSEMASMLIPYTAMTWWLALRNNKTLQCVSLILLWMICFVGYYDNWSDKPYREDKQNDIYTLDCLHLINSGSSELCPDNHPVPLQYTFEQAKKLDIKFTRPFSTEVK